MDVRGEQGNKEKVNDVKRREGKVENKYGEEWG